jgi:hypothetical protein
MKQVAVKKRYLNILDVFMQNEKLKKPELKV